MWRRLRLERNRRHGEYTLDGLRASLFELTAEFLLAHHDDGEIVALQRQQIAASNLALDDKAERFEEDLDRPIKGRLQNRSYV
jgi:hypothetical protein